MKCTTPPTIAALIKLSRITHVIKKAKIEGTVRIVAIIVPLSIISLIFSLDLEGSDNMIIVKNGNKNQRYFIFGGRRFVLLV